MKNDCWANSDLYLCAALKARGVKYIGAERNTYKAFFYFDVTEEDIKDLVNGYFEGTLQINAFEYATQIKMLKNIVHRI